MPLNEPRTSATETSRTVCIGQKFNEADDLENEPIDNYRRMTNDDLLASVGPIKERKDVIAYICGPPAMTDWAVGTLSGIEGMRSDNVFCEKWW